jgi:hypothetical protein
MQSVFGDADAPIVVELAQIPDLQGVPGGRARDADRGAAAVPRRLGAAGTGTAMRKRSRRPRSCVTVRSGLLRVPAQIGQRRTP